MKSWFYDEISDAKILDFSMEVFRKKLKSFIGFKIIFAIILVFIMMVAGLMMMPFIYWIDLGGTIGIAIFMYFFLVLMGVVMCLDKAGIFHITYGYLKGEDVSASEALGKAFQSFKPIIRVVALLTTVLVPVIIILVMNEINASSISLWQNKVASNVLLNFLVNVVLYSFVAALVGSYLFYSLHIAIFEKLPGVQSIKKSIHFAKGEGLRNIVRVFSIFMIQWAVNLSIYSTIAVVSGIIHFLLGRVDAGHSFVAQILLYIDTITPFTNFIIGLLLQPISATIWTLYYANVRYRKDAFRVEELLEQLEEQLAKPSTEAIDLLDR